MENKVPLQAKGRVSAKAGSTMMTEKGEKGKVQFALKQLLTVSEETGSQNSVPVPSTV